MPSAWAANRIRLEEATLKSVLETRSRSDGGASFCRDASQALVILFVVSSLSCFLLSQDGGAASLSGTVRDPNGNAVANAVVQLEAKDGGQPLRARTDAEGRYHFTALNRGVYQLSTAMNGYQDAQVPPIFLAPKEAEDGRSDAWCSQKTPDKSASVTQPQFYDQPQFTVAGVMDTTNLGGHGSDTVVRTREKLAEETVTLGKASAGPSSIHPAEEKSLREDVAREPSSFDANHRLGQVVDRKWQSSRSDLIFRES